MFIISMYCINNSVRLLKRIHLLLCGLRCVIGKIAFRKVGQIRLQVGSLNMAVLIVRI